MQTQRVYREPDYKREDENAVIARPVKCYSLSEIVVQTAIGRGLRCERVSLPAWDFVVVKAWATKAEFKAAQYEWLQAMISTQPRGGNMPPCEVTPRANDSAAPAMRGATTELNLFV